MTSASPSSGATGGSRSCGDVDERMSRRALRMRFATGGVCTVTLHCSASVTSIGCSGRSGVEPVLRCLVCRGDICNQSWLRLPSAHTGAQNDC